MGPRKQPPLKLKTVPQVLRYMPSQTLTTNSGATAKHSSGRVHSHRKPRVHHMRSGNETVIWTMTLKKIKDFILKVTDLEVS